MKASVDRKALRILFDTYWSTAGWKNDTERSLSPEDFAYAKSHGVMFDATSLDHVEACSKVAGLIKKLNKRIVADAFLSSLSSRRLDWRSALGSYAVFQHMVQHASASHSTQCSTCGFYLNTSFQDINQYNFTRFKWGGVRHDQIEYAALDLDLFLKAAIPAPVDEDIRIFRNLIQGIADVPSNVTSAALHSWFAKSLKSNKAERDIIIEIFGYCGILGTPSHPGYSDSFVPFTARALPDRHFLDMAYPACWWRGDVGINSAKLNEYFGHVL